MTEKQNKGFRVMDPEKQREIARRGGRVAHEMGVAHEYTRDEARAAGKKGGTAVAKDRAHMSAIGRLGGLKRAANVARAKAAAAVKDVAGS